MTFEHLANLMLNWGYEVKPEHYDNFETYLKEMLHRRRVMIAWNGPIISAVIMYHLTDNYSQLYKKRIWDIPEDNPDGHQIYIDKMICRRWTKSLRSDLQSMIEETFPKVTEGYYHRAPYDRCIKIYRRGAIPCTR